MVQGTNSLHFSTGIDNSGLRSGAGEALGIVQGLGGAIGKINPFAALAVGAVTAFTTIANSAYKMASAFEVAMAEVRTIAGVNDAEFKKLGKDLINLSNALGTETPDKLAKGLYEIIGAGYEAADALKVLEVASKAATAGVTTSAVAADGLTTILNSFRLSAEDAEHVADIMFATVDRGKISFQELASQISTVAPLAASSGFSFEQIGAALSTLTKQGVPAGVAMTQIRSAIVAVNEVLGSNFGKTNTLQEGLQKLYDQAGGDQNKLKELAGRIEAVGAVLAIAGPNFKGATEDLKAMGEAAGSVDRSFKIVTSTGSKQWEILRTKIKNTTIALGDSILEVSKGLAKDLNTAMDMMVDKTTEANSALQKQERQLILLRSELEDANTSEERRVKIYGELKTLYPNLLGNMNLEKLSTEDLAKALADVNEQLILKVAYNKTLRQVSEAVSFASDAQDRQRLAEQDLRIANESAIIELGKDLNKEKTEGLAPLELALELQKQLLASNKELKDYRTGETSFVNSKALADLQQANEDLEYWNSNIDIARAKAQDQVSNLRIEVDNPDAKRQAAIDAAAAAANDAELNAYEELLENKKKAYDTYNKEIDALGKERADEINKQLLKEGEDYRVFLKSQLDEFRGNKERERIISAAAHSAGLKLADRVKEEKVIVSIQPIIENIKVDTTSINAIRKQRDRLQKEFDAALDDVARAPIRAKLEAKNAELAMIEEKGREEVELYKDVTIAIEDLTARQLNGYIAYWQKRIAEAKKSGNAQAQAEAEGNVGKGERQKWKNTIDYVSGSMDDISEIFRNFGDDLTADLIDGLRKVAGELDNLFKAMDSSSSKGDRISSGISGVVSLIGMVASASAKRKQAEEEYYLSVIGYQKQYNQLLNDQILARESASSNVFTFDYINELKTAMEALDDAGVKYRDSLDALMDGRAKMGQRNAVDWGNVGTGAAAGAASAVLVGAAIGSVVPVIGTVIGAVVGGIIGIFAGKKKKDRFGALLAEYPELVQQSADGQETFNKELAQTLIDQKLVNDKTKLLLEDTIKWTDQLKEAREQIAGVIETLAGDLGNNLRNTLVTTFEQGGDAAKAMGETISDVLENILEQLIFDQIFSAQFQKLQKEMEKSFDLGGDNNWVDDFSRFFTASKNLTDDFNKALQDAQNAGANFGFDLFKGDGSKASGLAGAISAITEDTANILAGTLNSIRIDVATGIAIAENSSRYLSQIALNTSYNKHLQSLDSINQKMGNIETTLNQFESRGL